MREGGEGGRVVVWVVVVSVGRGVGGWWWCRRVMVVWVVVVSVGSVVRVGGGMEGWRGRVLVWEGGEGGCWCWRVGVVVRVVSKGVDRWCGSV